MSDTREKLIELLRSADKKSSDEIGGLTFSFMADYLIANGVTVQKWIPAKEPQKESGDPVELMRVVHGKWRFKKEEESGKVTCYCTACGRHSGIAYENQLMPYCPNCGAKIDGPWTPSNRVFIDADVPDTDFEKWIPVSKRLPEESGLYITFGCTAVPVRWLSNFDKDIGKFGAWWNYEPDGKEHPRYRFIEAGNITHWMPLPEPPKENDHAGD